MRKRGSSKAQPAEPGRPEAEAAREGPGAEDPAELEGLEAEDLARAAADQAGGAALAEPPEAALARLEREVGEWKDRALRSAAELDNFRKRAFREREEAAVRAQVDLLARIVEVIDDLGRVARLDPESATVESLHEGMLAIERKFLRALEAAGVERLDPAGEPFDPNSHEAVAVLPSPSADADHTVGAVYQPGYRLRNTLLRPARVAVYQWTPPAEPTPESGS